MNRAPRPSLAVLATAAALLASSAPTALGGDSADISCELVEMGAPGSAGDELRLTAEDYVGEVTLDRRGTGLRVRGVADTVDCAGATSPTVDIVDRVLIEAHPNDLDSLLVDLRGGPLGPGATPEPDGTSEIEIDMLGSRGTVLGVVGTPEADLIELGSIGVKRYGVNLNATEEQTPDADVVARNAYVALMLGAGPDRIDPLGGRSFPESPFGFAMAALGGRGDDVLVGNGRRNLFRAGAGNDELIGGGARDRIYAGSGADSVHMRDGLFESVRCGRGRDTVVADRGDELHGCEQPAGSGEAR